MSGDALPRVVFVAGLARSGSTLLDRLLGASPGAVAVGEAFQTLQDPPAERRCSCGAAPTECVLWGPVLAAVGDGDSPTTRYQHLLDIAPRLLPPGSILVDESKRLDALQSLLDTGAPVDVVLNVRDVRSWTVSQRQAARRRGRLAVSAMLRRRDIQGLIRRRTLTSWAQFTLWRDRNLALERRTTEAGVLRAVVGYERLTADPERELRRLCAALELEYDDAMLVPGNGVGHILRGNVHPDQPAEQLTGVQFGTRWLTSDDWVLPSLLRRRIMAANRRLVYGNR